MRQKCNINLNLKTYLDLAVKYGCSGFVLETPTWRASPDWVANQIKNQDRIQATIDINNLAVMEAMDLRDEYELNDQFKVIISGNVGPRGDGYNPKQFMNAEEAKEYHKVQVQYLPSFDVFYGQTKPCPP